LFQIVPRGSFEIQDEYMTLSKNERQQNTKLRDRVENERVQYMDMVEFKKNEDILMGGEVMFRHLESNSYLTTSSKCSQFRTDSFRLELSSQLNSAMIFKILPCHTY
jgi:inositol 1,4,5-triphosphate receptor type 1/inositol 1,4,5-triphosphate receptor type 3